MIDASAFNFDAMKEAIGQDPFAQETNKYGEDTRFYKLQKDKDGNGAALIRFLFDSEKNMIQKMFKINTTITKNGKKRFVDEYSPSTVGLPCPFQEKWQDLWNAGKKENVLDANKNIIEYGSKSFGRGVKYVTNIKVLKDPANPANEGKIFLYEMSGAMRDKIQNAVDPSESDRALGATPKELFNPLKGNSFRLVSKKGANGMINYDSSEVINEVTGIYDSVEDAIKDIQENTHKLSGLVAPESFLSYEELTKKLKWVTFTDTETVTPQAPLTAEVAPAVATVAEVQPAVTPVQTVQTVVEEPVQETPKSEPQTSNSSLDDLLKGLV